MPLINRSGRGYGKSTNSQITDVNAKYTSLVLSGENPAQAYNEDNSGNNVDNISSTGAVPSRFSPYNEGYYSNYFDGNGDFITTGAPALQFGNAAYTVEMWFNYQGNTTGEYDLIESNPSTVSFQIYETSQLGIATGTYGVGGTPILAANAIANTGVWTHVAVSRASTAANSTYAFINGALVNTFTDAVDHLGPGVTIGGRNTFSNYFTGHISNLRAVKGTALYTSSFTPSTVPLTNIPGTTLLTCQSATVRDNSINRTPLTKVGNVSVRPFHPFTTPTTTTNYSVANLRKSVLFGPNAIVAVRHNNNLSIQSGENEANSFVAEVFVYFNSFNSSRPDPIITKGWIPGSGYPNWGLWLNDSKQIELQWGQAVAGGVGGAAVGTLNTGVIPAANTWYHIAAVKTNTDWAVYVNGTKSSYAGLNTASDTSSSYLFVGWWPNYNNSIDAYISNLRIYKGSNVSAPYYANLAAITVPTAPLTAIANTRLLLFTDTEPFTDFGDNHKILANALVGASPYSVVYANNAVVSTTVYPFSNVSLSPTYYEVGPKNGSLYFPTAQTVDGSIYGPFPAFGTGDFTIDWWAYPLEGSFVNSGFFNLLQTATPMVNTAGQLSLSLYNSWPTGYLNLTYANSNQPAAFYNGVPKNEWSHWAIVRKGSLLRIYLNGISVFSVTDTYDYTSKYVILGTYYATAYSYQGYLADFRIVTGEALYTSSFIPPRGKSIPTANTSLLVAQTSQPVNNTTFYDSSSLDSRIIRSGNPTTTNITPFGDNWSYYFDGTEDYLTVLSNSQFAFGTGDFTVEGWVYLMAYSGTIAGASLIGTTGGASNGWSLNVGQDINSLRLISNASGTWADNITVAAGNGVPLNTWTHLALVRNGGTITIYKNGVPVASQTGATAYNFTSPNNAAYVGYFFDGSNTRYLTGYISNIRVVKGIALYTAAFTPSTTPLTTTSNTSLLTGASNRIVDNSETVPITKNGEVKVTSFSPFDKYTKTPNSYSYKFDSSKASRIWIPDASAPDLDLGSQDTDFTIESWFKANTLNDGTIVMKGANGGFTYTNYVLYILADGRIEAQWGNNGFPDILDTTTTVTTNKWYHVAMVKSNNTVSIYLDGNLAAGPQNVNLPITGTAAMPLMIGAYWSQSSISNYFDGLISNLRIVKRALYTSNFTPSTSPLKAVAGTVLLTLQDPILKDNGPNNYKFTTRLEKVVDANPFGHTISAAPIPYSANLYGGSAYFDGAGDYLTVNETTFQRVSNAFTIQGWFNATSQIAANISIVSKGTASTGWEVGIGRANTLIFANASSTYLVTGSSIKFNEWNHFAVVRSPQSNRTTVYLNGNLEVSGTINNPFSETSNIYIGSGRVAGANLFTGYISGIQIDNSAIYYANNFIVPTTAVTRTANTVFYLENTPGIVDYTSKASVETVGNVKLKSFGPYFQNKNYSHQFNGVDQYNYITGNSVFALDANDFTIEAWIYPLASGAKGIVNTWQIGGAWILNITSSNLLNFTYTNAPSGLATQTFTGSTTINPNMWTHVAIVRKGSTLYLFVNGKLDSSTAFIGSQIYYYNGGVKDLRFGIDADLTSPFRGWIYNLRIVNGTGLYTSPFIPSTQPLTAVPGTLLLTAQSNSFVDQSTNNYTINTSGGPTISQFYPIVPYINSKFDNGKSLYFSSATGDFIRLPAGSDTFNFGTGDFTVEFSMYPTFATANEYEIVEATTTNAFVIYKRAASAGLSFRGYANTDTLILADANIVSNVWTHITVSRSNSYTTAWVNGLKVANTFDLTNYIVPTTPITIGARFNGDNMFNGYIRDLKVTKGVGKYTSNGWSLPNRIITNKPFVYSPTIDTANNTITIDYLAVGGGGAGGYGRWAPVYPGSVPGHSAGGGGGGGGVLQGNLTLSLGEIYNINVGIGGIAAEYINQTFTPSSNTTFTGGGFKISAFGGGYGGWVNPAGAAQPGGAGGSGGGGSSTFPAGSNASLAQGRPGQGIVGIAGSSGNRGGAGGSGAGQTGFVGATAPIGDGGKGGDGANSSITGTMVMYGAGGGGGAGRWPGLPSGTGGYGGGAGLPVSMVGSGGDLGIPMAGGWGMGSPQNPQAYQAGDGFTYGSGGGGGQAQNSINTFYHAGNGAPGVFITKLPISAQANTTGNPNVILYGTSIVYQYTNPGTFSVPSTPRINFIANVLVVAGGGGGGGTFGGGGGAGGFRNTTIQMAAGLQTAIIVGAGGAGGVGQGSNGTKGANSSITLFSNITTTGGGYGGNYTGSGATPGGKGGSGGGGGAGGSGQPSTGGEGNYEPFNPVQGYSGGNNFAQDGAGAAGGGGGANQVGAAGASNTGGKGGDGAPSLITGANVIYAGGGGGGSTPSAGGLGGAGGGGNRNVSGNVNTGGGGGGGSGPAAPWVGGTGGSGVVIISYPDIYPAATSNSGATYSLVNNSRIYSFITSGTITI
jgi:hypothetical protein